MNLGKTKIAQIFRHRVYIPFREMLAYFEDRLYGIKTQRIIELSSLGISLNAGSRYEPIFYENLRTIFQFASAYKLNSFLDIGCGLGRPFVVAKKYGYNNYYGVDISEKLIELCYLNVKKLNINCSLSVGDIDEYQLPEEDLFIYLFNPFGGEKMKNLVGKLNERSSKTLVAYHNPKYSEYFPKANLIEEISWSHFGMYSEICKIYLFK